MRAIIVLVMLLAFIPAAVYAGDCGGCDKCKTKCSSCDTCKPKCDTGCKSKCDTGCKPKCESKCNTCKPKCKQETCSSCKPKCDTGCKSKCDTGCKPKCESKCNTCEPKCDTGCPKPCACMDWEQYCGCEMLTGLCITITACEGTAGPLLLKLRDINMKTIADVELAGPIDGYYNYNYTFAEPMRADMVHEAVLINGTDDAATLTSLQVIGLFDCGSFTFIDHTCPGAVIGPGGCPRMVLF